MSSIVARPRAVRACVAGLFLAAAVVSVPAGAARPGDLPGIAPVLTPVHAIALAVAPGTPPAALPPASAAPALPAEFARSEPGALWVAVEVGWAGEGSALDLEPLAAHAAAAAAGKRPLVVVVRGALAARADAAGDAAADVAGDATGDAAADAAGDAARRKAWLGALRAIARRVGGQAAWYLLDGVLPEPGAADDARRAEYEIKAAATTLRGEQPGCGVALRLADPARRDLLLRAYALHGDLAPYVDGVAVAVPPGGDLAAAAQDLRAALLPVDAGASVWVEAPAPDAATAADELPARAAEVLAGRADLALVRAPEAAGAPRVPGSVELLGLARVLGPSVGGAPASTADLEPAPGAAAVRYAYFFDEAASRELIPFWAPASAPGAAPAAAETALLLGTTLRGGYGVFDPTGRGVGVARTADAGEGRVRLDVSLYRRPLLLAIERRRDGGRLPALDEQAGATGTTSATIEEVIASHQAWRAFQDERLQNVLREGDITFRTRFGQLTGTFDIGIKADYYWQRGGSAEWALRDTYFNGVRLNWDKFPEIPFIGRDAIVAVPLELTFDRRYRYELDGVDEVEGRSCWRVRFEPLNPDASLYRGRAWIDRRTGALVRVSRIAGALKPPLIGDEETQTYRPFEGPDGTTYWLLDDIDGQQIYTVSGGNLVVLRRTTFGPPRINAADFEGARAAAYASDRQMLRDSPEGLKWMDRAADGTRTVLEKGDPTQLFAVAGAFYSEGVGNVLPLAGVNYTNIDTFGKGAIFNVFFAGVLANVTLNRPGLFGTRMEAGATLNAVAFSSTDKEYQDAVEIESRQVKTRNQWLRGNLGVPLGQFLKLRLGAELNWRQFGGTDETAPDFVVPVDHLETVGDVQLSFDRAGWGFGASYTLASRNDWEPWGPPDDFAGPDEVARTKSNVRYELGARKTFFLPLFQKIDVAAAYRAGSDFDRFSAFDLGGFGGLRGFDGSGIRYDRGIIGTLEYGFNIGEVLRFDAEVEHARVHDPRLSDELTGHTGVALAGSFAGPWQTIVRADVGYALQSDLDAAEGGISFTLVVLRLW